MTAGPATRPITSAVIDAITARKVMYWTTRRKPNSGPSVCNQLARLSSMGCSQDGLDHPFHLHEARSFHQHAGGARQLGEHRRVERGDVREVAALHRHGLLAQREEL